MRRMQQMAGQMGMFNPMAIQFGAYGAYAQAVSIATSPSMLQWAGDNGTRYNGTPTNQGPSTKRNHMGGKNDTNKDRAVRFLH